MAFLGGGRVVQGVFVLDALKMGFLAGLKHFLLSTWTELFDKIHFGLLRQYFVIFFSCSAAMPSKNALSCPKILALILSNRYVQVLINAQRLCVAAVWIYRGIGFVYMRAEGEDGPSGQGVRALMERRLCRYPSANSIGMINVENPGTPQT